MTLTFHLYHDGIQVEPAPISRDEIERYTADSKRSLADRKQRMSDAIHRAYETMRDAKPQMLIHLLVAVSIIGLHCIYV